MWQKLETVVAMAVNHHLDVAQAAQFEEFYEKNLRGRSKLFFSKIEETTVAGRPLDMDERQRNLQDGFSLVFRSRESEMVLDWWVGRHVLYLDISVPAHMTDVSIFRHSELPGLKVHQTRMETAAAQVEALQGAFHDDVTLIVLSDCPDERMRQLAAEGLDMQEIDARLEEEGYSPPPRTSAAALRDMAEEALQSWYVVPAADDFQDTARDG